MELTKQQCEACRPGATPVSETDRATYLERLEGWSIEHENDIPVLVKVYKLADYAASVKFTNAIAAKAEEQDHHPAITLEWGKVTVRWWTHKIENLHMNDFIMAAHTDEVYEQFRPSE